MNKYYLIGIPNSGKTTLGKRAAKALNVPFYDIDEISRERVIPERAVDVFLGTFAEKVIAEQQQIISELSEMEGSAIISTSAENALMYKCISTMLRTGTVIYIRRSQENIIAQIRKNEDRGIVFVGQRTGEEIVANEKVVELYARKHFQYEAAANLTFENNGTEDEGLAKLLELIKEDSKYSQEV
jgi:shikimate kinase